MLKQVHPDTGISNKAMAILNSFVNDIFERIATEASSKMLPMRTFRTVSNMIPELAAYSKKSTISSREIQTSVRLILPGELAKHAISEGTKSVTSAYFPVDGRIVTDLEVQSSRQQARNRRGMFYFCFLFVDLSMAVHHCIYSNLLCRHVPTACVLSVGEHNKQIVYRDKPSDRRPLIDLLTTMARPKRVVNPDPLTYRPLPTPAGQGSTTIMPPTQTHKMARKSRSKLNLRSPPSTSTLKSKSSETILASEAVLARRAHNTTRVPINKLPPELLSTIFLLLTSSPSSSLATTSFPYSPRPISQVCYFWRCVALSEPLLWARTLNLHDGPKWVMETLRRSGECLIDVVGCSRSGTGSRSLGKNSGNILNVILKELRRIRRLHLTIERKEEWRVLVDWLSRCEAPVLESLAVKSLVRRVAMPGGGVSLALNGHGHGFGDGTFGPFGTSIGFGAAFGGGVEDVMRLSEGLFQGSAPKLKNLSLTMVSLGTNNPSWLSKLTALQVTDLEDQYLMSVWEWLSIVRQTPLLETLTLRSVFANEAPPENPSDAEKVVLKKLKSVELKGTMMETCEFLERLVIPGECRIHMDTKRANNAHAARMLSEFLRERKMRAENMEGILKTPEEAVREAREREKKKRWLLVHPSTHGLHIKVDEVVGEKVFGEDNIGTGEEQEGCCVVNLLLSFGCADQSEERHRLVMDIFDTLTRALQMVYEDKGGFDSLNLSLFGLRDGIRFWESHLVQFFAWLDRVEHLQEVSGYTASVVFPILVQSPLQQDQYGRRSSVTSIASSPSERYRQNVLLPTLQRVTLAFVEFGTNVDDEFDACCDVRAVPDFVRRRHGLKKEIGGISVVRQRTLKFRFECCSGPRWILDELKRLGVEYGLGWACDFEDSE